MQDKILSTAALLYPLVMQPLSNVPFHKNSPALIRYVAEHFPVHLAVHEISALKFTPAEYTQLHCHTDEDEINIILSVSQLRYKIQVGEEEYIVRNNTSIFIPRGTMHSANVLSGSGFFITMRFS